MNLKNGNHLRQRSENTLAYSGNRAGLSLIFNSCHVCIFWFQMNNIRDNRQASKVEMFFEPGREINRDTVAQKNSHRFPLLGKIVRLFELLFAASNAKLPLNCRDRRGVYFVYLVFIESVTMVSRHPLNQLQHTKERP